MSRGAGGQAFLCPEGTKFNQRTLVCDHARRVKCSEASSFFHRNLIIHEASMKVDRLNSSKKKTANKEQQGNFLIVVNCAVSRKITNAKSLQKKYC